MNIFPATCKGWASMGGGFTSLFLLLVTGCVNYCNEARMVRTQMMHDNFQPAITWANSQRRSHLNGKLGALELGRIYLLGADFKGSSDLLTPVLEALFDEEETGPVVKMDQVGGQLLAATVTDDRSRPYEIPPYELIQALQCQTLNALALGEPESARVWTRRAAFAQEQFEERLGRDTGDQPYNNLQRRTIGQAEQWEYPVRSVLDASRNSYGNGIIWFLYGLFLEKDGDGDNARIAYGKALSQSPENPVIRRSYRRISSGGGGGGRTELIVIYEESFVSMRVAQKIPLPLTTMIAIDYPVYTDTLYQPMTLSVSSNRGGRTGINPALNVQALAYHNLKEQIPGIIARNVTRAGLKIAAQQAANNSGNDSAIIGVLLANTLHSALSEADLRSWSTLPQVSHIGRLELSPGTHMVSITSHSTGRQINIPLEMQTGESRILWIVDSGAPLLGVCASLTSRGSEPVAFRTLSLLSGARPHSTPETPR